MRLAIVMLSLLLTTACASRAVHSPQAAAAPRATSSSTPYQVPLEEVRQRHANRNQTCNSGSVHRNRGGYCG